MAVSQPYLDIIINDLLNAFVQIKTTGSTHGVTYSQTVAFTDDDIPSLEDLPNLTFFPAVMAEYSGETNSVERRGGEQLDSDAEITVMAVLNNATHKQLLEFIEDIKYAIEFIPNSFIRKASSYRVHSYHVNSIDIFKTIDESFEGGQFSKGRGKKNRYRIALLSVVVSSVYTPKLLRS